MRERPILFSGAMVRAILAGQKTQTRRLVKFDVRGPDPYGNFDWYAGDRWVGAHKGNGNNAHFGTRVVPDNAMSLCPYGAPGDRLWVRETWRVVSAAEGELGYRATESARRFLGSEDGGDGHWWRTWEKKSWGKRGAVWVPAIHMPRWASRLTLEVTSVRVERLHDISEEDARAEGMRSIGIDVTDGAPPVVRAPFFGEVAMAGGGALTAREVFASLWDEINGKRVPWASNPWAWVIDFRRVEDAA